MYRYSILNMHIVTEKYMNGTKIVYILTISITLNP